MFSSIKFRKYAKLDDVQEVYTEALRVYDAQKGKPGVGVEFKKVQEKFLKQVHKHLTESSCKQCLGDMKFDRMHVVDKSEWNKLYEYIWDADEYERYDAETRFTRFDTKWVFFNEQDWRETEYRSYIPRLQCVLGQCATLQSTTEYQFISDIVQKMQDYIARVDAFNARGSVLYEEFKQGWFTFYNNKESRYEYKKQERQYSSSYSSSYDDYSYSKYFSGCTTEVELKKKHREWAKKLHPDRGGNAAEFRAMQEEYESLKKSYAC